MSLAISRGTAEPVAHGGPFRVMVVDDSAVIRGIISRWLEEDPNIKVVTTCANGAMAVRMLERSQAELVVLDIEMPEMDGMTALPKLIELVPDIQVIMASTLTRRNADISLQALKKGAADYVPKPETNRDAASSIDFRRELVEKVKALGGALRRARQHPLPDGVQKDGDAQAAAVAPAAPASASQRASGPLKILAWTRQADPQIIAIGASTGGPQALFELFSVLRNHLQVPVVITQHMPPTFTAILADHLQRQTGQPCKEAEDGEVLRAGKVYIAPGNHHLLIERRGGQPVARLTQTPPENFCRPAVDPMFRSLAKSYGPSAYCVVLTGMGHDGTAGGQDILAEGGTMIVQDEASSVVWGMPGSLARAGMAHAILPLKEIAPKIVSVLEGGKL